MPSMALIHRAAGYTHRRRGGKNERDADDGTAINNLPLLSVNRQSAYAQFSQ